MKAQEVQTCAQIVRDDAGACLPRPLRQKALILDLQPAVVYSWGSGAACMFLGGERWGRFVWHAESASRLFSHLSCQNLVHKLRERVL